MKKYLSILLKAININFTSRHERNLCHIGFQSGDFPYVLWRYIPKEIKDRISHVLPNLCSQYGQDLFVYCCAVSCDMKGSFIEAGATNGINWSNTYILECSLGWDGILVEPCKAFHQQLRHNRNASFEFRCLLDENGSKVSFVEVLTPNSDYTLSSPELSSVASFLPKDWASQIRSGNSVRYDVDTIDFSTLATLHRLDSHIGYLSLDTEGSELAILQSIDFNKYSFDIITVEHNFIPSRMDKLRSLLSKAGYIKVLENASHADYWFVSQRLYDEIDWLRNTVKI